MTRRRFADRRNVTAEASCPCAVCRRRPGEVPKLRSTDPPRHVWWCRACHDTMVTVGFAEFQARITQAMQVEARTAESMAS